MAIFCMGISNLCTAKVSEYLGVRTLNFIAICFYSGGFLVLSYTTSWGVILLMFYLIIFYVIQFNINKCYNNMGID